MDRLWEQNTLSTLWMRCSVSAPALLSVLSAQPGGVQQSVGELTAVSPLSQELPVLARFAGGGGPPASGRVEVGRSILATAPST